MTTRRRYAILLTAAATLLLVSGAALSKPKIESGDFYEVAVERVEAAGKAVARITAKGKGGFHCNLLYPWKLTVEPAADKGGERTVLKKGDARQFTEKAVVFEAPAGAPADRTSATLKLSMCDDRQCKMASVSLSW